MIAVIDYGMGNLRSVEKGFLKVGVDVRVTNKPEVVRAADAVVLPGVGAFRDCMRELTDLELIDAVKEAIAAGKPYLGICLGLQVLFSESEEFGRCKGLDIFRGKVVKFDFSAGSYGNTPLQLGQSPIPNPQSLKVPHMGWNGITMQKKDNPLFAGITDQSYFYFVHSFYVAPDDASVVSTTTNYGIEFTSSIWKDNVFAVQFHPEKSQASGLKVLRNFGDIAEKAGKAI